MKISFALIPLILVSIIALVYKRPVLDGPAISRMQELSTRASIQEEYRDGGPQEDEQPSLFETIQIFHAKRDPAELSSKNWTAQVQQDRMVAVLTNMQRRAYFVDLAANHAVTISNTYGLERNLEWNGLCIEGNSQMWKELVRRQCQLVAAVVGQEIDEKISFLVRPNKDGLSGIVNENFDNKQDKGTENEVTFVEDHYAVPLVEILRHNHAPKVIDYLSLDVEGAEFYVMEKFPFEKYQFRIITIERPQPELRSLLRANNYTLHAVVAGGNHGETLWFHNDHVSGLNVEAFTKEFSLPNQEVALKKWG
ncbi:unnamed protein product [Cylindrotheca closterium]|uniref:Methyltransferase FkbM domain-containing protein n=1 Tax=Cylindrotheca closterium TaxID=2856 RepID=A0AAD2FST3_9STRA|nr:unnamed protein product [Cylindrotheca closterium]